MAAPTDADRLGKSLKNDHVTALTARKRGAASFGNAADQKVTLPTSARPARHRLTVRGGPKARALAVANRTMYQG